MRSDIKAAFLNIRIVEEDRDLLRFLWIGNIEENEPEVTVKRFTSVVFGLNCSPFLLGATIKYHVKKYFNRDFNSEIVDHFLQDLYTEDSISGTQTEVTYSIFICVLKSLPKEGLIFVNILGNLLQRKRKF